MTGTLLDDWNFSSTVAITRGKTKMAPTLYMMPRSPPVRAVQMTAKTIGLDLNIIEIDLAKGDHKTPDFLKLNPQHTVPTLVDDDGFAIWDSHAIMPYLISKYAKNDDLYPKDAKKRAIIDQRLYFESGVAWSRVLQLIRPILYKGQRTIDQEDIDGINEVYTFLEAFLGDKQWIAGNSVTIADFSLLTTITSADYLVKLDATKYPKVAAWLQRADTLPVNAINKRGNEFFVAMLEPLWN